jgi:hypothetical protein
MDYLLLYIQTYQVLLLEHILLLHVHHTIKHLHLLNVFHQEVQNFQKLYTGHIKYNNPFLTLHLYLNNKYQQLKLWHPSFLSDYLLLAYYFLHILKNFLYEHNCILTIFCWLTTSSIS